MIDQLLATPAPPTPTGVHLATANSPVAANLPWVLYAFDDPALRSLSADQKIMLRMGPVNERRVKVRTSHLDTASQRSAMRFTWGGEGPSIR